MDLDSLFAERKRLEDKISNLTTLLKQCQDEAWNLKSEKLGKQREFQVLHSQLEETTRQCEEVSSAYLLSYLAKANNSLSSKESQYCYNGEDFNAASANSSSAAS